MGPLGVGSDSPSPSALVGKEEEEEYEEEKEEKLSDGSMWSFPGAGSMRGARGRQRRWGMMHLARQV